MDVNELELLFKKITSAKSGKEQRLDEIERRLLHLREGEAVSYADLEIIADSEYWPFNKYWMWPSAGQIEAELGSTKEHIKNLARLAPNFPDKEDIIIGKFNILFKSISLTSILLRFALPEHFAIYSWPTLAILRIERGGNAIDEYRNYICEMRILRETFGVTKTADIDKIIWAIFYAKGRHEIELKNILSERIPESLTPKDLIDFLYKDPLKVAKAYYKFDDHFTAGLWTAKAFESFLYSECRKCRIPEYAIPEGQGKRSKMIYYLRNNTSLWRYRQNGQLLWDTKEIRNQIVAGDKPFTASLVEEFIQNLTRLRKISAQG